MSIDTLLSKHVRERVLTGEQALYLAQAYNRFMAINGQPVVEFTKLKATRANFRAQQNAAAVIPGLTGIRSDSTGGSSCEEPGADTLPI